MGAEVRIEGLRDPLVEAVNEHLARHLLESGRHGIHWLPYDPRKLAGPPAVDAEALNLDPSELSWQRWFVAIAEFDQVVGHLSLKGARFDRGLHRCELGMGLEFPYWRRGLGTRLLEEGVRTARSLPGVDWLDLRVLECNAPALALYRRFGFEMISRVPDFCRIEGKPEADLLMSLDVASSGVQAVSR